MIDYETMDNIIESSRKDIDSFSDVLRKNRNLGDGAIILYLTLITTFQQTLIDNLLKFYTDKKDKNNA